MVKSITVWLFVFLVSFSVDAQDKGAFKFYLLGGGDYRTFKWESWNTMASSYNTGWQATLASPMEGLDPQFGYSFGAGVRLMVFGVEVKRYGFGSQARSFDFLNGDSRELRTQFEGWDLNFPIVAPVNKYLSIGMDMQMNIEKGTVQSAIIYADGTRSMGMENPQNGIFNFNKYSMLFIGPRIEIGSRVRGQISVMWPLGGDAAKDVVGLKDQGSDYGGIWSNGDKTIYFVTDFAQRNNYNQYFVGVDSDALLLRRIKGMKVEVTVAVDLFKRILIK